MPDKDHTAEAAQDGCTSSSSLKPAARKPRNPYLQVALTYVRRPFTSWQAGLLSLGFFLLFVALLPLAPWAKPVEIDYRHLLLFTLLCGCLAGHVKGQFADWRAHLLPGYRRAHAAVAAVAGLLLGVVLPTGLAWSLGWHATGLVSVAVLLLGVTLWIVVNDATWTSLAILCACAALFDTPAGRTWFSELIAGHLLFQAAALLSLGALVLLIAAVRLVRLNEDMAGYSTEFQGDWEWRRKTHRAWREEGLILRGLRDWMTAREMARLTRHARRAAGSWWSRICRWRLGMAASWSAFWVLGAVVYIHIMATWIPPAKRLDVMLAATSAMLLFLPSLQPLSVLERHKFRLGLECLLPVDRKSYIRQLGLSAILSPLELWAGLSSALVLWWLLAGPQPFPLAALGGAIAFSAAFLLAAFGVVVWLACYRSPVLACAAVVILSSGAMALLARWATSPPGHYEALWIAGPLAVLGLLITFDAYRRWLLADLG